MIPVSWLPFHNVFNGELIDWSPIFFTIKFLLLIQNLNQ